MKIFQINAVPYGSTARIMLGISQTAERNGYVAYMSCGYSYHPIKELQGKYIKIGSPIEKLFHTYAAKITGLNGYYSYFSTLRLIKQIKQIKPDVLHLHNLHGWYLHLPTLFSFIKKENIKVVWTLHDCWAFTGHCPYFDMVGCEKWQTECYACPQYKAYPATYFDCSKKLYKSKKSWFTRVKDMTIVTPSVWLAEMVKQSYLKEYKVQVINNGIDLSAFAPIQSDFKNRYGLEDKTLLLGVALDWGARKGLDVFVELAKRLPESFQIVLIGTNENIEKQLPDRIISIRRTQNVAELAEIYTAADIFVNPTREDNFPTVNIEALACGTPIVTFKTGGSPEILDETCGVVVEKNDIDAMEKEILRLAKEKPFSAEACRKRAEEFDKNEKFKEYLELYK